MTDADRRSRRFDDWSESSNDRRDFEFGSGMKHEDSLTFLVNDIKVLTRVGDYSWSRVLNLLVLLGLHLQHACKYDFCKMITHTHRVTNDLGVRNFPGKIYRMLERQCFSLQKSGRMRPAPGSFHSKEDDFMDSKRCFEELPRSKTCVRDQASSSEKTFE